MRVLDSVPPAKPWRSGASSDAGNAASCQLHIQVSKPVITYVATLPLLNPPSLLPLLMITHTYMYVYRYPHSGDHGPERNYMKKIAKKKRKIEGTGSGGEILGIDARGMLKDSSERVDPEQGQKPTGREKEVKREIPDISAILQGFRKVEKQQPSGTKREREDRVTFE